MRTWCKEHGMQQILSLLVAMNVLSDGSAVDSRAQLWLVAAPTVQVGNE